MNQSQSEITRGRRFAFGANWQRFLKTVDEEAVAKSAASLGSLLQVTDLAGIHMLDIGCGSGLSSLAARRLGATVHAFDYDPGSVACSRELKRLFRNDDPDWRIEQGSILDRNYVDSLGRFDLVYSWGVLHHTGQMWEAIENACRLVAEDGRLCIAIYNDQGWRSRYWLAVKQLYNQSKLSRRLLVALYFPYLFLLRHVARSIQGKDRKERGMSLWHDMIDWLGGLPFQVSTTTDVITYAESRFFRVQRVRRVTRNRPGCNEFVFRRLDHKA